MRHSLIIRTLFVGLFSFLINFPSAVDADQNTLRIPLGQDIGVPDPDIFYAVEGLVITNNVYDGLLRYKAGTTELEPAIAKSYEVSSDGLRYTFHIRPGVKFHDGTEVTAEAARISFQRRVDLKTGPSYMLDDVENMDVPDPMTFVVTLKQPVSAFLDWLAAPYGPKILSPRELSTHGNGDLAQKWLQSHDAGTGPYMIDGWKVGQLYTLKAFTEYWDGSPHFSTVEFPIIPSAPAQALQLERGDLDMILSGLPIPIINSFRTKENFKVQDYRAVQKAMLFMNTSDGVFADVQLRKAMRNGLNRRMLVDTVYGQAASVSTQFYPTGSFPEGLAPDNPKYDPQVLKNAASGLRERSVVLQVPVEYGSAARRLADLIQVQLAAAGLNVTVQEIPISIIFDMVTDLSRRPDLLLLVGTSDAGNADSHIRIYFHTDAPVNSMGCSVPAADAAMDQGLHATTTKDIQEAYAKAAKYITEAACVVNIADVKDTIVARDRIRGVIHDPAIPTSVRLQPLRSD